MKNKLIIQCSDNLDVINWIMLSANGVTIEKGEQSSFESLAKNIDLKNCKIIILMASSNIVIKQLQLPKKFNTTQLRKIIPHILEEDLISNIDTIHFSYSKPTGSQITVAIVEDETLKTWLSRLRAFNIEPEVMYPLCLSMNINQNEWGIWLAENNLAVVKTSPEMGFSIEYSEVPTFLHYLYEKSQIKPESIKINTPPSSLVGNLNFTNDTHLASIINHTTLSFWEVFDKEHKSINLLHNSYAKHQEVSKFKFFVFHTLALCSFLLLVLLGLQVKDILSYNKLKNQQQEEIATIYKSVYPNATQVSSPKLRMENDLKNTSNLSNDFYEMLFVAGKALNTNNVTLKRFAYKNHILEITVEAANYPEIEKLISELKKSEYDIHQTKAEKSKEKLNAVFTISRKSQ